MVRTTSDTESCVGCFVLVLIFILALAMMMILNYGGQEDVTGVVDASYVKRVGDHDRFFVVLRSDNGQVSVFQNRDTAWWLKWDSADLQARMKPGTRVRAHTVGYRWHWGSWFPNVVRVQDDAG